MCNGRCRLAISMTSVTLTRVIIHSSIQRWAGTYSLQIFDHTATWNFACHFISLLLYTNGCKKKTFHSTAYKKLRNCSWRRSLATQRLKVFIIPSVTYVTLSLSIDHLPHLLSYFSIIHLHIANWNWLIAVLYVIESLTRKQCPAIRHQQSVGAGCNQVYLLGIS